MNGTTSENLNRITKFSSFLELFDSTAKDSISTFATGIVICPAFVHITKVSLLLQRTPLSRKIWLGAQDLSGEDSTSSTGDVSGAMLADVGCNFVIIGHSERLEKHGESPELISRKIHQAKKNNLIPIVCVGENLDTYENGDPYSYVLKQLQEYFGNESLSFPGGLVIAYEPIWAIGTGSQPNPKHISEMVSRIKGLMAGLNGGSEVPNLSVLYGGSLTVQTANDILSIPEIDGALVGGASLDPEQFSQICSIATQLV